MAKMRISAMILSPISIEWHCQDVRRRVVISMAQSCLLVQGKESHRQYHLARLGVSELHSS